MDSLGVDSKRERLAYAIGELASVDMRFDVRDSLIISLDLDVLRFEERSLWDYFFLRERRS